MTQTVSHELRNPLNSIIMQQDASNMYMKEAHKILKKRESFKTNPELTIGQLNDIFLML
jgi:signal transduction histidine kinase